MGDLKLLKLSLCRFWGEELPDKASPRKVERPSEVPGENGRGQRSHTAGVRCPKCLRRRREGIRTWSTPASPNFPPKPRAKGGRGPWSPASTPRTLDGDPTHSFLWLLTWS